MIFQNRVRKNTFAVFIVVLRKSVLHLNNSIEHSIL